MRDNYEADRNQNAAVGDLLAKSPSNWGRWDADDEVGALKFLTDLEVLRDVPSVRQGKVFNCGEVIGNPDGDPVGSAAKMPADAGA
jgi:hypothetical protein